MNYIYERSRKVIFSLQEEPIRVLFLSAFVIFVAGLLGGSKLYGTSIEDLYIQLVAQAHGAVLEILIMGALVFWINKMTDRKKLVDSCLDEIEELRPFSNEYTVIRAVRNIKKLNKHKVDRIDLSNFNLRKAPFEGIRLIDSNLSGTNFEEARLFRVNFEATNLSSAIMAKVALTDSTLNSAIANATCFEDAHLVKTSLRNAKLVSAQFDKATLNAVDLSLANLANTSWENATLYNVDFRGVIGLTIDSILKAKFVKDCQFDPEFSIELEKRKKQFNSREGSASADRHTTQRVLQKVG
jgi:uncharacterized protein YjbI with pentapeptide repeats